MEKTVNLENSVQHSTENASGLDPNLLAWQKDDLWFFNPKRIAIVYHGGCVDGISAACHLYYYFNAIFCQHYANRFEGINFGQMLDYHDIESLLETEKKPKETKWVKYAKSKNIKIKKPQAKWTKPKNQNKSPMLQPDLEEIVENYNNAIDSLRTDGYLKHMGIPPDIEKIKIAL